MKIQKFALILSFVFACSCICLAQTNMKKSPADSANANAAAVRSTAAYAEVLLRKTDLESTLEDLMVAYTEDFPKVRETRFELNLIQNDLNKLLLLGEANTPKMTLALGKLLVRRAALQTDYEFLKNQYNDAHPDVERAKRRVVSFEKAVNEILQ